MRAVFCALQLGRMLLGRQRGAVCLEPFFGSMDSTCPQDVAVPYMTDGRHAPDTLFVCAGIVMCCPRSATTMSTSAAATRPTQAVLMVGALQAGTTTGAWKAFALKGEIRNTNFAMCAPLSIKALIGASRCIP